MTDAQQEIVQAAIARYQQSQAQTKLLAAHVNELTAIVAAGQAPEVTPEVTPEEVEQDDDDVS